MRKRTKTSLAILLSRLKRRLPSGATGEMVPNTVHISLVHCLLHVSFNITIPLMITRNLVVNRQYIETCMGYVSLLVQTGKALSILGEHEKMFIGHVSVKFKHEA